MIAEGALLASLLPTRQLATVAQLPCHIFSGRHPSGRSAPYMPLYDVGVLSAREWVRFVLHAARIR